jgi:hypothetical protein
VRQRGRAGAALVKRDTDLLILDLNGFEHLNELAGVGALIRSRAGADSAAVRLRTQRLAAGADGLWHLRLPYLPDPRDELQQAVKQALTCRKTGCRHAAGIAGQGKRTARPAGRAAQPATRAGRYRQYRTMASQICLALCNFPACATPRCCT